jgi:hypothetical protein
MSTSHVLVRAALGELRNTLSAQGVQHAAAFICSASFEERSRSIALRLAPGFADRAFIAQNVNHADLHLQSYSALVDTFGENATGVPLNTESPIESAETLRTMAETISAMQGDIVVDITTFTHESLLVLLHVLLATVNPKRLVLCYTHAAEYSVGSSLEQKWLSRGLLEVRSVVGYPGLFSPSKGLHLIVLGGLEHERALELIRHSEPSLVSIGIPASGPQESGVSALSRQRTNEIRAIIDGTELFEFSADDPWNTKAAIESRIATNSGFNVSIAPLNTKLSTLGAALAAEANEEIQLCYPRPLIYNYGAYSAPGTDATVLRLA